MKKVLAPLSGAELVYRLSVVNGEDGTESTLLYSVRLDGEKSCVIGTAHADDEARALIYHSKNNCQ